MYSNEMNDRLQSKDNHNLALVLLPLETWMWFMKFPLPYCFVERGVGALINKGNIKHM